MKRKFKITKSLVYLILIYNFPLLSLATSQTQLISLIDSGQHAFERGDFETCNRAMETAIASVSKSDPLEVSIHKLLGLCLFKSGKKTASAANFRAAHNLDPNLQLTISETGGDEDALEFFANVISEKTRLFSVLEEEALPPIKTEQDLARTQLIVKSNRENTAVLLDGIFLGHPGESLTVDVGAINLEVVAPGYPPKTMKVLTKPGTENHVEVFLSKDAPEERTPPFALPIENTGEEEQIPTML